jgi:endonuclease-3
MARETKAAKAARAARVIDALELAIPEAKIALDYRNELELLVAVMLSAQTTDALVNKVTPALFAKYRSAADYAAASEEELREALRRIGLFRNKAKNLKAAMAQLVREHAGQLPRTRELLETLPGVGWKTAGVVANHAFGAPAFPVDTHVGRLARRMGFSREEDPGKVERDLCVLLAPERWGRAHQLLIWHGRRTCTARGPRCEACPVRADCPRVGVEKSQPQRGSKQDDRSY